MRKSPTRKPNDIEVNIYRSAFNNEENPYNIVRYLKLQNDKCKTARKIMAWFSYNTTIENKMIACKNRDSVRAHLIIAKM